MKKLTLLSTMVLCTTLANAAAASEQTYSLKNDSISPNKEYRFVLTGVSDANGETFAYGFVNISTGRTLWKTPSAYQMVGQDDSWALQQAQSAKVYWSNDSTRFVLDEAIYRTMGNAILGSISEAAHSITTHTFVLGDLIFSGASQWRIQVDKGWISPTTLSMKMSGIYDSKAAMPGGQFAQKFTCEIDDATHFRFVKTN